jgi:hypothetical protein
MSTDNAVQYRRLLLVDQGVGLYEQRTYTASAVRYVQGFACPKHTRTDYILVKGPVFLPDRANDRDVISVHGTKVDALRAVEQLAGAQFHGKSGIDSEIPLQPQGREISGHRAGSMSRGSGILYAAKSREGFDPRDYNGVVTVTDTGRSYWVAVWHRKVNGRAALEVQLSPKV